MPNPQGIEEVINRNNAVVDRHFEHEAAGNVAGVLGLYSGDPTWISRNRGLVLHGLEAIAANYHDIFDGIDKAAFETKFRLVTPRTVLDYSTITFTATKDGHFSGTKKGDTGTIYLFHRFEIDENGKILIEEVDEMLAGQVYEQSSMSGQLKLAANVD